MKTHGQQNKKITLSSKHLRELVVLLGVFIFSAYFLISCTKNVREINEPESAFKPLEPEQYFGDMSNLDFKTFKHNEGRHATIPCLLCHQPNEESPKPKFASHQTCAGCHVQQFKEKSHDICTICHTNSETGEMKAFPPLKTFGMEFNHTAHFKETNCATCHQTQGTSMTIPSGVNAHVTCVQCHTSDKKIGEKNFGSCSTCHQQGKPNRISAETTNVGFNFSHSRHSTQNCQSCHSPTNGNNMSAINVSMHSGGANGCAACHNGQKAFGANAFSDCRKCHQEVANTINFGIRFSHADHSKKDCATCHKSGGKGVNFSVPNGQNAHNTCFQCHQPMKDNGGGFTSGKCFTCHQVGGRNDIKPSPQFIGGNFSHSKHTFLDCDSCHTSTRGQMSAPTVAMHKQNKAKFSCANCHNNEMAFGESFADCKKCHTNSNFNNK